MNAPLKPQKTKPPISEIDALARIEKILKQLDEKQRARVLAFLSA